MLIQNTSSAALALGLTGNSAPVAAGAPALGASAAPGAPPMPGTTATQNTPQQSTPDATKPTDAQLKNAVDTINNAMKQAGTNVEFIVDKSTKQTVIKVVESGTGQVITQFPSQSALAVSQMIENEQQHGLLIQQSA
jgi:flagellar protein FlaG